jgi:hypothetical protein
VDFFRKQAVVTVDVEKYDENALIGALEKYVLGGEVITPPALQDQPASADKSTKAVESRQADKSTKAVESRQKEKE